MDAAVVGGQGTSRSTSRDRSSTTKVTESESISHSSKRQFGDEVADPTGDDSGSDETEAAIEVVLEAMTTAPSSPPPRAISPPSRSGSLFSWKSKTDSLSPRTSGGVGSTRNNRKSFKDKYMKSNKSNNSSAGSDNQTEDRRYRSFVRNPGQEWNEFVVDQVAEAKATAFVRAAAAPSITPKKTRSGRALARVLCLASSPAVDPHEVEEDEIARTRSMSRSRRRERSTEEGDQSTLTPTTTTRTLSKTRTYVTMDEEDNVEITAPTPTPEPDLHLEKIPARSKVLVQASKRLLSRIRTGSSAMAARAVSPFPRRARSEEKKDDDYSSSQKPFQYLYIPNNRKLSPSKRSACTSDVSPLSSLPRHHFSGLETPEHPEVQRVLETLEAAIQSRRNAEKSMKRHMVYETLLNVSSSLEDDKERQAMQEELTALMMISKKNEETTADGLLVTEKQPSKKEEGTTADGLLVTEKQSEPVDEQESMILPSERTNAERVDDAADGNESRIVGSRNKFDENKDEWNMDGYGSMVPKSAEAVAAGGDFLMDLIDSFWDKEENNKYNKRDVGDEASGIRVTFSDDTDGLTSADESAFVSRADVAQYSVMSARWDAATSPCGISSPQQLNDAIVPDSQLSPSRSHSGALPSLQLPQTPEKRPGQTSANIRHHAAAQATTFRTTNEVDEGKDDNLASAFDTPNIRRDRAAPYAPIKLPEPRDSRRQRQQAATTLSSRQLFKHRTATDSSAPTGMSEEEYLGRFFRLSASFDAASETSRSAASTAKSAGGGDKATGLDYYQRKQFTPASSSRPNQTKPHPNEILSLSSIDTSQYTSLLDQPAAVAAKSYWEGKEVRLRPSPQKRSKRIVTSNALRETSGEPADVLGREFAPEKH